MQSLFLKVLKCGLFFGCFFTFTVHAEQHQTFSIQLKQAPLVPTLQQLALAQNVNLIIDDELQGTLSLQLDNVDLDQLFRSVAKIKQLDLWQENGIYYLSKLETTAKFAPQMETPFTLPAEMTEQPTQNLNPLHHSPLRKTPRSRRPPLNCTLPKPRK